MSKATINSSLLKSQMVLRSINNKDLATAQNWSMTTTYRKLNGRVAFTAPEIQVCVELLKLDSDTASEIFFVNKMS